MNVTTLAGVYVQGREVLRILGTGSDDMRPTLKRILENKNGELGDLGLALMRLETHLRVMGLEEVELKGVPK